MLSSISGQTERWAQLGVYPPSSSPSGAYGGANSAGPTAAPSGTPGNTPPAAAPSAPLSDDMSFTLMAINATQSNGQSPDTPTTATSPDQAASDQSTQTATNPASQLYTDVQSLMSALTGTTGSTAGTTSGLTADASTTDPGKAMLQDMQTVSADLAAMASTSASAAPPDGAVTQPAGLPPRRNDISNTGTSTSGEPGGWTPTYSDGFQKQFALAAYSASSNVALDTSDNATVTSINA